MSKRKRAVGVNDLMGRTFVTYDFAGKWLASFGSVEQNFRMLVHGESGNGKTEFVVKLSKYLTRFGKVYYNSFEQGVSKSLQDAFIRNEMGDVNGKLIVGDKDNFEEFLARMKARNSPRFGIIDSLDYMNLTAEQYKQLVEECPNKSFIIICWSAGRRPKTQAAKDIEYMTDIKVRVHDYKAYPRSRFGGNVPFDIWPEYHDRKRRQAEKEAKAAKDANAKTQPSSGLFSQVPL